MISRTWTTVLIVRPYATILMGGTHMIARKGLGRYLSCLAVRHSVDYSSSDHFSSDDSSRDSSSSSSSETSSDSSANALFDSASSRTENSSFICYVFLRDPSSFLLLLMSPSRKGSILLSICDVIFTIPGAFSSARVDLLPSPKRIRSPETSTDLEGCSEDSFEPYVPRETRLGVDVEDESSKPSRSKGIDLEAEIDECIAYADALRARGINARVVVEAVDREEIEASARGPTERFHDHIPKLAQEGAIEVTYDTLGDLGHMIIATGQQSADILEMIKELNNRRLRDMMDVPVSESLRPVPGGIWATVLRLFLEYPSVDSTMPNTRSGASRTREGVNEQLNHEWQEVGSSVTFLPEEP
ncbi:hypothetical protein Tco_0731674 [Tanacetum coccineum]